MNLLVLSTAPVWALLTFFYVRDRYDKEPRHLLIKVFVCGMLITLPAGALSFLGIRVLEQVVPVASRLFLFLENYLFIGFLEEYFKYLVVWRIVFYHPAFNEPYDGMIYAITASLGFAAVENVLYVANGGMQVAILRGLLSVPGHALFAAAMGYYFGLAKFAANTRQQRRWLRQALLLPTLLHGTYDLLLSTQHTLLLMGVVPLSIGMWIMALHQIRLSQRRSPFRP